MHCKTRLDTQIACTLGLAKRDLWGLGSESWFVVASYTFAKMTQHSLLQQTMTAPRLQRSRFANPNVHTYIDLAHNFM